MRAKLTHCTDSDDTSVTYSSFTTANKPEADYMKLLQNASQDKSRAVKAFDRRFAMENTLVRLGLRFFCAFKLNDCNIETVRVLSRSIFQLHLLGKSVEIPGSFCDYWFARARHSGSCQGQIRGPGWRRDLLACILDLLQ